MSHTEILDAMGNIATDAEAEAMVEILRGRAIKSLDEISDEEWFALIPQAVENARQHAREDGAMKARCTACGQRISQDQIALHDEGYIYCWPCASAIKQEAERQHAREVEGVCGACGGRTINGKCGLGCEYTKRGRND